MICMPVETITIELVLSIETNQAQDILGVHMMY